MNDKYYNDIEGAIAVIGMSGAFSKARNIEEYWQNLLDGKECIDDLSEEEMRSAGIPKQLYENPNYVRRTAGLESAKDFDPAFFGYTPVEAGIMDPQHRLFLEHAWKCLEDGNIIPNEFDGLIGVFGGCSQNNYLLKNLIFSDQAEKAGSFQMMIGNDKDYLTTKVSYKLNLKGPSITMQTACSTSLTTIQQGCLSLLNYQSDMVLCGGASINIPYRGGYLYQEGMIFSPDGHCRAFDKNANGTIFGDGVGIVLLKRFEEALEDGDHIYAIIRGSAINNDGSEKIGYTAPGVKAQAEVIATALAVAEVSADTIGYVEAHGTGTLMGDPIEMAALTEAFRMSTERKNYCYIGSVKPNIGHLDAAAGVAGFIKTVKVLNTGIIPPLVNFSSPNPALNIEDSPFKITPDKKIWGEGEVPRRAGISALGVGGTNIHLVLEAYSPNQENNPKREENPQLIILSAKSEKALINQKEEFISFLERNDNIASISYTLQKKRQSFAYRDFLIVDVEKKYDKDSFLLKKHFTPSAEKRNLAFMFTGQGSQYPDMGKGLYDSIPYIKQIIDEGLAYLEKTKKLDLRKIMFPTDAVSYHESEEKLMQTTYTQPALFLLEYATALYMLELGLQPALMLGHSLGEYTAACISGIFTFKDALSLVAERGRIMQTALKGSMISIPLSENEINEILDNDKLQISVINAPKRCVVSGTKEDVEELKRELDKNEIQNSLLKTSHAYHSFLMDNILDEFAAVFTYITFHSPNIPIISNLSGGLEEMRQMQTAGYWVEQLRQPVNFEKGISYILKEENLSLVEIGPGNTLITMANLNPAMKKDCLSLPTIRGPRQKKEDYPFLLSTLGKLWQKGHSIIWEKLYNDDLPAFTRVPTYEFDNKEYWVDAPGKVTASSVIQKTEATNDDEKDYLTTKQHVLLIWKEILGSENIREQDNFYDLGGHSVLATQLLASLNDNFGIDIGIAALLMNPTPANSINLVEKKLSLKRVQTPQNTELENSILPMMFPIQKGDRSKHPLFMVAGLYFNRYDEESGEAGLKKYEEDYFRYFSTLVKNIGPQQPVYGFRPKGIFLYEKAHKNVPEMANAYIQAMKTVQPEGPYLIGGECIGGIVAMEIAQQLMREGEKVKHLILLDTFYPQGKWLKVDFFYITRNRIIDELVYPFKQKGLNGLKKLGQFLIRVQQLIFPLTKKQRAYRDVNYGNIFYLIKLMKYKPAFYEDSNVTILANEEWADGMSSTLEWKEKHFSSLNIVTIPGTHVTSLTDYGHVTGNIIRKIIEEE